MKLYDEKIELMKVEVFSIGYDGCHTELVCNVVTTHPSNSYHVGEDFDSVLSRIGKFIKTELELYSNDQSKS